MAMAHRFFSKAEHASGCERSGILKHRGTQRVLILALFLAIGAVNSGRAEDTTPNKDSLQLISTIVQTLENEFASPSSNERRGGNYLTYTQRAVRKQISALSELGPAFADNIYSEAMKRESKTRTALVIALGLMKDPRVKNDIRDIVRGETDPSIRGLAVRALSQYADTLDVPLFVEAIRDTNVVVIRTDVPTPDGKFHKKIAIVALEAVPALYKLGYKWELDSLKGRYEAVKTEK